MYVKQGAFNVNVVLNRISVSQSVFFVSKIIGSIIIWLVLLPVQQWNSIISMHGLNAKHLHEDKIFNSIKLRNYIEDNKHAILW